MTSIDGSRRAPISGPRIERREAAPQTPRGYLERLPITLVLDRFPIPILAVHEDGVIVYVNAAFADMLGYGCSSELIDRRAELLLADTDHTKFGIGCLRGEPSRVDLRHREGWTLHTLVSTSALVRADDPVALVAVHDMTEQLWARTTFEIRPGWSSGQRSSFGA
ncbi:PAS domain-containing protein [Antrihabitans cavernicola]|nr:PAS domain-containing protein [Spelaeibacter cavernicola]